MNQNTYPTLVKALHKSLCGIVLPILLASCGTSDPKSTPTLVAPALANLADQTYTEGTAITALSFGNTKGAVAGCKSNPTLPAGLSLTVASNTCQISGTPTEAVAEKTYTITATNSAGSDTATIKITVEAATTPLEAPALTNAADQTYTAGTAITALSFGNMGGDIQASGCTVDITLPAGLTLANTANNQTCQISGIPAETSDEATYTITATNNTGSDTATVKITVNPAVTVGSVKLKSSGDMTTPQTGDDLTLTFATTGTTDLTPQVMIGGQLADVVRGTGDMADQWTATVTVGANFMSDGEGFEIIVVVPNGNSPTEDLSEGLKVATVGTEEADLELEEVEAFTLTPILVLETASYRFVIDQPITAITFTNEGGAVDTDATIGCAPASGTTLPMGLILAVSGDTCQITGMPTVLTPGATYTIVATNDTGINRFDLNIAVANPPSMCADITRADVAEYPINTLTFPSIINVGSGSMLYVRGNHSKWNTQPDFLLKHKGSNTYQAVATFDLEGSVEDNDGEEYDAQETQFKLASDDVSWTTQLLAVDAEGAVRSASNPINVSELGNAFNLYEGTQNDNNYIQLTTGSTYSFTFVFNADTITTLVNGAPPQADVGTLTVEECIPAAPEGPYTIVDSSGVATGNFLSSVYTTNGLFTANDGTTTNSADGTNGAKITWSETGGEISVNYLAATGTGLFVNQFDADPTVKNPPVDPTIMDLSAYAEGSIVFEINVDNYLNYLGMIVKADSPPYCACDQKLGKIGDGGWETVVIPISDFPTTGNRPLDLTQVSASFVISPEPGPSAQLTQIQEAISFKLRNIRWERTVIVPPAVTPVLADITSTTPLTTGLNIVPITFTNNGIDATMCSVDTTTNPALPMGLDVALIEVESEKDKDTCQIIGTPASATPEATYTIVATAADGSTDTADVTFVVEDLPTTPPAACASLVQADATGYPVTVTGYSERLYVRGNLSNWQAHPDFILRHKGSNVYQAAFTLGTTLLDGSDPATTATQFKVASDDTNWTTQFNVIDDSTSNVGTASLNLNQRYEVDKSDGTGLNGNNPVALRPSASYVFTLALNTADPTGAGAGDLYIQDCSQTNVAPDLANVVATQNLLTTQASVTITFLNGAGAGAVRGCSVDKPLPMGLTLAVSGGTCVITGAAPIAVATSDTYTITATNAGGDDADAATVTIVVNPALAVPNLSLTDTSARVFTVGTPITDITFTNGGGAVQSDADGCRVNNTLPSGLTLAVSGTTCEIAGTPDTAITAADYVITGKNATGDDLTSVTINITVNKGTDTRTYAQPTVMATIGDSASEPQALSAGVGDGVVAYAILDDTGNLAPSSSIATIGDSTSGVVTIGSVAGTVMIQATIAEGTNYLGKTVTYTLTVTPEAPDLVNTNRSFRVGQPASFNIRNNGGAVATDGCSVSSYERLIELPEGLSLVVSVSAGVATCQIVGTPTAATTGSRYEISATNLGGVSESFANITVNKGTDDTLAFGSVTNTAVMVTPTAASVTYAANLMFTRAAISTKLSGSPVFDYTISGAEGVITADIATIIEATGAVTITGVGEVTITATLDDPNYEGMVSYTLTVNLLAPVLMDMTSSLTFTVGAEIDPIIFTNNGGAVQEGTQGCQFTSSSGLSTMLPAGLTLAPTTEGSPRTCQITGTPMAETPLMQYTITGRNIMDSDTATVTITVDPAPDAPDLVSAGSLVFAVGAEIDPIIFTNDGGDVQADAQGCQFTSSSGSSTALPAGLTLTNTADNQTCQITGTPMAETPLMQYTITARNVTDADTATVTITVTLQPPVLVAPNPATATATVGVEIDPIIFTNEDGSDIEADGCELTSSGGDATNDLLGLVWSVSEDNRNCVLSGTPTTEGTHRYDVIARNTSGPSNVATVTITVANPPAPILVALNPATADGTVGEEIDLITFTNMGGDIQLDGCELTSSGGDATNDLLGLVWSVSDDNRNCVLTGRPTTLGVHRYDVIATNAGGPSNVATVTITVINPDPPVLVAPNPATADGTVGAEIDLIVFTNTGGDIMDGGCQLTSSGGSATTDLLGLVWSVSEDNRNCVLSGTPTEAGVRQYDVIATNAGGPSGAATVTITVVNPQAPNLADYVISLMNGGTISTARLKVGEEFTPIIFTNSGGDVQADAQEGCELTSSSGFDIGAMLPAGLTLTSTTGRDPRTCQITGTPTIVTPYSEYKITGMNAGGTDPATVGIVVNKGTDTFTFGEVANNAVTVSGDGTIASINFIANATFTRTATIDSGRSLVNSARIVYTSSAESVATVDAASGAVTILTAGNTTITATLTDDANYEGVGTYALAVEPVVTGDLANAGPQTYVLRPDSNGANIDPIVFVNSGEDMTSCTATLPAGLSVVVSADKSCEITGVPTAATAATTYTITGVNDVTSTAVVTLAVVTPSDFPDFDISSDSEATGLTSGNFYSVAYSAAGDFSDIAVSSTHAKVSWSATSGVTMVNYQATTGVGRLQVTQSADPSMAAPVNLGDYAEGYIAFDINVPDYGSYTNMVVKSDSAGVTNAEQNLGQVGHGAWQTIFFPVTEYITAGVDLAAVTTVFVIYPDEDIQATSEALSFMIRNIRWTNTEPFLGLGAPALADIAGMRTFTANEEITPITFTNSGGHVTSCVFSSGGEPITGSYLSIAVFSGTCRITGRTREFVGHPLDTYIITATNAGNEDEATISIAITR